MVWEDLSNVIVACAWGTVGDFNRDCFAWVTVGDFNRDCFAWVTVGDFNWDVAW